MYSWEDIHWQKKLLEISCFNKCRFICWVTVEFICTIYNVIRKYQYNLTYYIEYHFMVIQETISSRLYYKPPYWNNVLFLLLYKVFLYLHEFIEARFYTWFREWLIGSRVNISSNQSTFPLESFVTFRLLLFCCACSRGMCGLSPWTNIYVKINMTDDSL